MMMIACFTVALMVAQTRHVLGINTEKADKRPETVCEDHSLVADRCDAWKELDFCVNHQQEMQFVCNKTCNYCVPDQWAAKRIWGQIQVPDTAMNGPRFTESKNSSKKPFIQILGKEDLDAAAAAIVKELESPEGEKPQAKPKQDSGLLAVQILGRVQSRNESRPAQNGTRPAKLNPAEATSRRIINQLSSMSHDYQAESVTNARKNPPGNDRALPSTAPTTPPSRSRFELNTTSAKFPLYLYEAGKGRRDEGKKIKEASSAIKDVLKLFNPHNKMFSDAAEKQDDSTGDGRMEQLLGDIEASRTPNRKKPSDSSVRGNERSADGRPIAEGVEWRAFARKLALRFRRVLRRMRLREFAREHENAALRKQLTYLIRQETKEDSDDDDDDDDGVVERKRALEFRGLQGTNR